jgi:glycosyltransferase involved in cell wall biosynthesis
MRIAYIAYTQIPSFAANAIQVIKMCQAFVSNGQETILFLPEFRKNQKHDVKYIYNLYGVKKCFDIRKISVPKIKKRASLYALIASLKARKYKPDLVYTRFLKGGITSILLGMPIVYESHKPEKGFDKIFFSWIIRSRRLKKIVVISKALSEYYKKKYPLIKKRLVIAPDAANNIESNIKPINIKANNSDLIVGYVGQLYKGKCMEIISKLVSKCPWAYFYIVGGNAEDKEMWEKRIAHDKNVTFYGYVPHSKTIQYVMAFDVLLAPYQKQVKIYGGSGDIGKWMSPLKIFEYMAAGKPIISSNLPVLKEILIDKVNSLLCDPEKIEEWVEAIKRLRNKNLRKFLGCNAKREFLKKYTWNKRVQNILHNLKK